MPCIVSYHPALQRERRRRFLTCAVRLLMLWWMGAAAFAIAAPAAAEAGPLSEARVHVLAAAAHAPQEALDTPFDLERSAERLVNQQRVRSTALYFTCFGIYLLIGLIFLTYWRWMRRDLSVLAVGLLSLLMAVHSAAVSGSLTFLVSDVFDAHTVGMIETVSYLLLNGFIAFMLWAFFPDAFRPTNRDWIHLVNWTIAGIAVVTSIAFAFAALVFGDQTAVYVLSASRWIMALLMIVVVALALQALDERAEFSVLTVVGLALIVVGSIHDVLFAGGGDDDRPYMITFAVLAFVLLQSYVIMRRSAASARMARLSSQRLRREVDARTKELRAASIAAEAANMAKTDFVTAVTHELRTPLTSMLGYTQLLREEANDVLSPRHLEFLQTVRISGERLLKLVNDLLDLARIEAGRIEMNLSDVNVSTITAEVKNQLYPLAAAKGLYLRTEIMTDDPLVRADGNRLRQVLINLVSNAIKFTSGGGVTLRVRDTHLGDASAFAIDVADTGVGISEEFIPRLFDRFTREERSESDEESGTGLGLTIARDLIGHMHGDLTVESTAGRGTTFSVIIPRANRERDE